MLTLAAIAAGFVLDLIFGDPHWLPHPICLIGNLISFLEKRLRRICGTDSTWLLLGGLLMVVIVLALSFAVPYAVLYLAGKISVWLQFALQTVMCYQIFATRCLRDESMKVCEALERGDLADARVKLSWIVGRDTQNLDEEEVTKGAVETVAENTADGVIAPMFYMFLGGAPLAFLYKGINTMDSMVGYKNDKYLYFGRCAARVDDFANLIPARITGLAMILAAWFLRLDAAGAWRIFWRDRYNHLSPNSAMTESVTAGALGVQLGGDHYYFGKLVHKDTIGDDTRPVRPGDIRSANRLLYMTAFICILCFAAVYLLHMFYGLCSNGFVF